VIRVRKPDEPPEVLRTKGERARRTMSKEDVTAEDPLLLDPAVEDPETFISFREEVPYSVDGNARGEATIRTLGLRREALAEQRRKHLDHVKALQQLIELGKEPYASEARNLLQRMQQDSGEYAAMTRAFLRVPGGSTQRNESTTKTEAPE
jgi:hypothetical protein